MPATKPKATAPAVNDDSTFEFNLNRKRGAIKMTLSMVATSARVLDGELRMVEVTNYLDNVQELVQDYGLTVAQAKALLQS